MLRTVPLLCIVVALLSSCNLGDLGIFPSFRNRSVSPPPVRNVGIVEAYVPVYATPGDAKLEVKVQEAKATINGGKIFVIGNKLFQVETGSGLHIIDYSDKKKPQKLAFLQVPGCNEVALKGGMMYTNSFSDMLVLDITGFPDVKVQSTVPNVFPELSHMVSLPESNVYFVCPDYSKGQVISWKKETVNNPLCSN